MIKHGVFVMATLLIKDMDDELHYALQRYAVFASKPGKKVSMRSVVIDALKDKIAFEEKGVVE